MMGWFRRKDKKETGKGADRGVALYKTFDVLNYTPKEYYYLAEYLDFLTNSEQYLRKIIENMALDDQSKELQLDYLINMITRRMECYVDEQYTNHMNVIYDLESVYQGELVGAQKYMDDIRNDIALYDTEIEKYRSMQKVQGIIS